MLVNIVKDLCIGAAPCVAIAGDVFALGDNGIVKLIGEITDEPNVRLAAEACPTRAIFLYEDDKITQTFPPADEMPRPYEEQPIETN